MCISRKVRDREVVARVVNFSVLNWGGKGYDK